MEYTKQNIWRGDEIKFNKYFLTKVDGLVRDFMAQFPDFCSVAPLENTEGILKNDFIADRLASPSDRGYSWKKVRVLSKDFGGEELEEVVRSKYPTAYSIIDYLGKENVKLVTYSILEANSIIYRHTGSENKSSKYIRIHIPLIVPDVTLDEMGMEVNGEIIGWPEVFGFNNQIIHSVWNTTPYRRLVLIVDLSRDFLGIPEGKPWAPEDDWYANPFPKTAKGGWEYWMKPLE